MIEECEHKDENGNFTYDKVDDRIDTERGIKGSVWYCCKLCEEDITELVGDGEEVEQMSYNYDAEQQQAEADFFEVFYSGNVKKELWDDVVYKR